MPRRTPARLVSLTPSNTELVAFLGLTDRLVGVDDWSDWPPAMADVAQVGPDLQIDLDRVEALRPDLVLASLSVPGQEPVVEGLEARGLPHLVLAPKTLAEIVADVRELGARLGVPHRAEALAEAIRGELERLRAVTRGHVRSGDRAPARVYWEWWPKPVIAAGGTGWMTGVIGHAGGTNVFGDAPQESLKTHLDAVAAREPDVVVLCWQGALHRRQSVEALQTRPGWADLPAVEAGRVLLAPEALFGRPGPRIVEGVRWLAARLHPGLGDEVAASYAWLPETVRGDLGQALRQAPSAMDADRA